MATAVLPQESSVKIWSTENVQSLFETVQDLPGFIAGIPSPNYWKALLCVLFDTGANIRDVMKVRRQDFDSNWHIPISRRKYYLHAKTIDAVEAILPHKFFNLFPWPDEEKPGGIMARSIDQIIARAGIPASVSKSFLLIQQTAEKSEGLFDQLDLSKPPIGIALPSDDAGEVTDGVDAGRHAGGPAHFYVPAAGTRNLEGIPQSEYTLSEAWERLILPERDKVSDATLLEYANVLNAWKRMTSNPPVSQITRRTIVDFRDKLQTTPFLIGKRMKPRSLATCNKIIRHLHAMVSPLFPADRVYPAGLGLTSIFQFPKALPQKKVSPFVFNENQLSRLYLQADACGQTFGCRETPLNNPRLWRVGLVLALNCAARTFDLFNLRWQDVLLGESGRFRFGSIQFEARKTGKLQRIPLNHCAAMHLADLSKRPVDDSDRVFPGFNKGKPIYTTWRRICRAAEVDAVFEDMRKTSVTWHNNLVWNAGFWLSGHLQPGVMGNYDNPSERVFEAVYRLENPIAFTDGANKLRTLERFRPVSYRK